MTRINADLDPSILTDQHLMAEYREMAMVPASLRRSRRSQSDHELLKKVAKTYTLNRGHVIFFYNKLDFLSKRYANLVEELTKRGYTLDTSRTFNVAEFPDYFQNDWAASDVDRRIIAARLVERINQKPGWYKHYGTTISTNFIEDNYGVYL
jgi:deoxyribonuclease (pyrimidine dimer)